MREAIKKGQVKIVKKGMAAAYQPGVGGVGRSGKRARAKRWEMGEVKRSAEKSRKEARREEKGGRERKRKASVSKTIKLRCQLQAGHCLFRVHIILAIRSLQHLGCDAQVTLCPLFVSIQYLCYTQIEHDHTEVFVLLAEGVLQYVHSSVEQLEGVGRVTSLQLDQSEVVQRHRYVWVGGAVHAVENFELFHEELLGLIQLPFTEEQPAVVGV
mmetsp:Transcript_25557/g.64109  ORF Transcript_25557/g.64109 Transcript_25557/m.64109 type:complete len:213 (+) Transcript_25557:1097-1735(+)